MSQPFSKRDLIEDFKKIGIHLGMDLMVHSSLSRLGWVIGGAPTVVAALMECIGPKGTLVMPAATPNCLHPKQWDDINMPKDWIAKIEENSPLFDVEHTPTTMGAIPETFRNWKGTLRSNHPISSVCVNGKLAPEIIAVHQLELSEGPNTPYEKVYNHDFKILLLGVGFNRCTMLHFGESKSNEPRLTKSCYQVLTGTDKKWIEVTDMANDNGALFPKIGKGFLATGEVKNAKIGEANSFLFSSKALVDFAVGFLKGNSV